MYCHSDCHPGHVSHTSVTSKGRNYNNGHIHKYSYLQAKARHGSSSGGLVKTAKKIVGQSGVSGLYRGLDTKLIQSMTAAGFMFMSYENIFDVVSKVMKIDQQNLIGKIK